MCHIVFMIKNKTFVADVHVSVVGCGQLPFYNTNTDTKIDMGCTNHVLTFQAQDKHEVRRQVAKRVRELQSHLVYGEDYSYYINRIWEKKL